MKKSVVLATGLLASLVLVCGCATDGFLHPKNIMQSKSGGLGQLHVFNMRSTQDEVQLVKAPMDITVLPFAKYKAMDPDSFFEWNKTGRRDTFERLGAYAVPQGEYIVSFGITGYYEKSGEQVKLDPNNSTVASARQFIKDVVAAGFDSSLRMQFRSGQIDVVWISTEMNGREASIRKCPLGTIPDPSLNKPLALQQLRSWLQSGAVAKQYYAILLLKDIGDRSMMPEIERLANQDVRFKEIASKAIADIANRVPVK